MTEAGGGTEFRKALDSGLRALAGIAGFYRIAVDIAQLERELVLTDRSSDADDIVRAAQRVGLRARIIRGVSLKRLAKIPVPAIVRGRSGTFMVFGGPVPGGTYRLVDPITRIDQYLALESLVEEIEPFVILIARSLGGAGIAPQRFGFRWFLPSI